MSRISRGSNSEEEEEEEGAESRLMRGAMCSRPCPPGGGRAYVASLGMVRNVPERAVETIEERLVEFCRVIIIEPSFAPEN